MHNSSSEKPSLAFAILRKSHIIAACVTVSGRSRRRRWHGRLPRTPWCGPEAPGGWCGAGVTLPPCPSRPPQPTPRTDGTAHAGQAAPLLSTLRSGPQGGRDRGEGRSVTCCPKRDAHTRETPEGKGPGPAPREVLDPGDGPFLENHPDGAARGRQTDTGQPPAPAPRPMTGCRADQPLFPFEKTPRSLYPNVQTDAQTHPSAWGGGGGQEPPLKASPAMAPPPAQPTVWNQEITEPHKNSKPREHGTAGREICQPRRPWGAPGGGAGRSGST